MMYIVPFTTIGVVSKLPRVLDPCVYTARGTSRPTLDALMVFNGENRLFQ
jgi:hypothetical protein